MVMQTLWAIVTVQPTLRTRGFRRQAHAAMNVDSAADSARDI